MKETIRDEMFGSVFRLLLQIVILSTLALCASAQVGSDDTDGDGMPDVWEQQWGITNWQVPDGDTDYDGDNVIERVESQWGTDPTDPDTDDDGLSDNEFPVFYTDPRNWDTDGDYFPDGYELTTYGFDAPRDSGTPGPGGDLDGDWLNNFDEYYFGSNPFDTDTDDDGLPDNEFSLYSTYPAIPDCDFDGYTDGEEVAANTDPLDYFSHP